MRILYLECNMGAAGDMLFGALLNFARGDFIKKINSIGIPHVFVENEITEKCGIHGNHITVKINGHHEDEHHHHEEHHHHIGMEEICDIIDSLKVSDKVKANAIAVYKIIAEAESLAHNKPVTKIHFHEVGMMDAIADIVAVCMLIEEINPEKIYCSKIHAGSGTVKCSHGILPVPAPATAHILRGIPIYGGEIQGELCTPTGAALLKYFVSEFGGMPAIITEKIGYGMGTKDFPSANCLRAFLGAESESGTEISELSCNLDDMTPEDISCAEKILFKNGALDVFKTSIQMKKNRMGTLLTCLCRKSDSDKMSQLMLKHTTTLGVREVICKRTVLERKAVDIETKFGKIKAKISTGNDIYKMKPEYDDVEKAAEENNLTFGEVYREIMKG